MLLLALRLVGLASWADPITIWYGMSVGWLALAISFLRSTTPQRASITKHAVIVVLASLMCSALPYGLFTDDILRYQWDGWLTLHGVSPYAYAPNDVDLQRLSFSNGSATLPQQLPYADMLTIYPPGAQLLFAVASLISGGDAVAWKLMLWLISIVLGVTLWRMHDGQ